MQAVRGSAFIILRDVSEVPMVRKLKPLAIFLLVSAVAPITAFSQDRNCSSDDVVVHQPQAAAENSIKLKRIIFTGNSVLPVSEQERISAVLAKTTFKTQKDVSEDLKTLVSREWQQHGYFKVEVGEPEIIPDPNDPSALTASVWIDAGKQYRLAEIRFVKNTVFPAEKLRKLFAIQDGDIFDTWQIGKGIEEVRKLYGESGYISMSVVPTTEQQDDDNRVNLTVELDEGSQFRVGRVEVLGADEAKRRQITTSPGLVRGSIYDDSRVQKLFGETDVVRTIHEADGTIDFKIDLEPCVAKSQ